MFKSNKPLVIFEMANNHQGIVSHGKEIIHLMKDASNGYNFDFAIKFKYRNLDTFSLNNLSTENTRR